MPTLNNFLPTAYFEGQFQPFADAKISVATHAFQYGTGAFGGLRGIIDPKTNEAILLRLKDHAKRLSNSAKFLGYHIEPDFIESKIIEFVKYNQPNENFYIRPMVYLSGAKIGPSINGVEKDFLIYGLTLGDYLNPEGISCRFSSWVRQEDRSVPLRGKISGSYTMASMAKAEATDSGFDEALILNSQGKVCEASAMNLFMVRDGNLITPGVDQDILEGITRDSVLTIAKNLGINIIQRQIDKTELIIADEVFVTGTAGKVSSVNRIENNLLPKTHPITDKIRIIYDKIVTGQDPQYADWITRIIV